MGKVFLLALPEGSKRTRCKGFIKKCSPKDAYDFDARSRLCVAKTEMGSERIDGPTQV